MSPMCPCSNHSFSLSPRSPSHNFSSDCSRYSSAQRPGSGEETKKEKHSGWTNCKNDIQLIQRIYLDQICSDLIIKEWNMTTLMMIQESTSSKMGFSRVKNNQLKPPQTTCSLSDKFSRPISICCITKRGEPWCGGRVRTWDELSRPVTREGQRCYIWSYDMEICGA